MKTLTHITLVAVIGLLLSCKEEDFFQTPLPNEIPALEALLKTNPSDAFKVRVYQSLADHYKDTAKALNSLDSLIVVADRIGKHHNSGEASIRQGRLYLDQRKYDKAVKAYIKSTKSLKLANDIPLMATAYHNLGQLFIEAHMYRHALKFYKRAKKAYNSNDNPVETASVYMNLGLCYALMETPNFELAKANFDYALKISLQLTNKHDKLYRKIQLRMGEMYENAGNFKLAITHFQSVQTALTDLGSRGIEEEAEARLKIAECMAAMGRFDEAWKQVKETVPYTSQMGTPCLVDAHNTIAELYQMQGKHELAASQLEKALKIADKSVINKRLNRTILLLKSSYRELSKMGQVVGVERYSQMFEEEDTQFWFKADLEKGLGPEFISNYLTTKQIQEKGLSVIIKAFKNEKDTFVRICVIAVVLILIAISISIYEKYHHKTATASERRDGFSGRSRHRAP